MLKSIQRQKKGVVLQCEIPLTAEVLIIMLLSGDETLVGGALVGGALVGGATV